LTPGTSSVITPAAVDSNSKRLFVYGSLMEGFFNYKKTLEGKVISRDPTRARGLLYHQSLKGYPAMIPGEGWVKGELLELSDFENIILLCDQAEGYLGPGHCENEYERRFSALELDNGEENFAHIYWYVRRDLCTPENPAVPVPSGDWREFMKKMKISNQL
jgi:gamma-glutamylcyclotransferase (GGCT)/AIG2-like uncharacterized protein YtfP